MSHCLSIKVKRAASEATKSVFGLGVRPHPARPAFSRASRRFLGGLPIVIELNVNSNERQVSAFARVCRFLMWALVMFVACVGISTWVWLELDNLDDRAENIGTVGFEYKIQRSLAKRDLRIEWSGICLPRIYKVNKVRLNPEIGEIVSVDHSGARLIRPLGKKSIVSLLFGDDDGTLAPIVIELKSDDQGYYWEDEYTIFPPSQRGRG